MAKGDGHTMDEDVVMTNILALAYNGNRVKQTRTNDLITEAISEFVSPRMFPTDRDRTKEGERVVARMLHSEILDQMQHLPDPHDERKAPHRIEPKRASETVAGAGTTECVATTSYGCYIRYAIAVAFKPTQKFRGSGEVATTSFCGMIVNQLRANHSTMRRWALVRSLGG